LERSFPFGKDGLQVLWADGERVFCRGWRPDGDGGRSSALAVLPAAERPPQAILHRLTHEYELRDELDTAWAARPLALVGEGGRTTLLLEDPGGEPLARLIGTPMETGRFLRLAVDLVAALGKAHQRGLVHKDIKPANILVNCADGHVRLTGFGIASRLPRERQATEPPEFIAGTLAYMAPEQTGRMNRSIDSRSDLYAVGVTFYQMLTGVLPFSAADRMEWVHCHIARQPIAPVEQRESVPTPLSRIVMNLLAKTAEDRYQAAAGLEHDLRRCLAEWEAAGHIEPFALGERDAPDRLLIPERLYGREREINALLTAFDRVVTGGASELVLVSGYSGIGKSSVVNELHKALVPPRGLFASGKFDQYKRDIPYATLAQAFQGLVRQLLGKSETELQNWRSTLQRALEPNGLLIVNLVSELKLIIGAQPPVPDLPPQDAQNRFQLVFRRFINVFARPEHPLALFLDDLQWLDTATLDLLEHLVTHSEVRHLLMIGAYRDNEVGPAHPLLRTLKEIRDADANVHEIALAPLRIDDVGRLVADALHCKPERAQPLAHLVHEKTGGNPFFAIQFFTALAEDGLLSFDPFAPAWQWDMNRIRAKSFTDNVVDLMAGKLKRLSAATQEALKQFACLGNVAEIATLAMVCGETEETLHTAFWEAVHSGLVVREEGAYGFLHDRIQQAAYCLILEEDRADIHLRAGRAMLAGMSADVLAEHLFDVANQLDRGAGRLIDREEKVQAATIDLRAGRKAKASAAYGSARTYFAAGAALMSESDWDSRYELTFRLWLERAECEFLTGNFEMAEQLIAELLQRAASRLDQAAVYHLKMLLHTWKSENVQAVTSALTCLQGFRIDLPAHPTWEQVQAEYETIWQNFNGRPIESLIDLPLMTDPEMQASTDMLSAMLLPAYFADFNLYCLIVGRIVNVSTEYGMNGASASAYAYCGAFVLGSVFHRYREGFRFAKLAFDLVEKHGFLAYRAKIHFAMGMVAFWTQPITTAIDSMRAAFRTAIETGDLTHACYSIDHTIANLLVRNDPLDVVWRESEAALDFAREARYGDVVDIILSKQRFIANMQGRTATFSSFSDAQFDEAAYEAQLTPDRTAAMVCRYWIFKLKARFLSGNCAEALAAVNKVKPLFSAAAQIQRLDYFCYAALTVAALYEDGSADEQKEWRELLTAHREQLREWAENCSSTFADKHALVSAEIARLERRDADAMRLYEQAIRSARENGFVQNEGTAHEVAARFYAARGADSIAVACLRNARQCYLRWGADGKVGQLDRLHPQLTAPEARSPTATLGSTAQQLDLATVVKASQAVSSEIFLPKLIERLMTIAIENAGADRGLLILPAGDDHLIQAEARATGDQVEVVLCEKPISGITCPESLVRYVIRTGESVILDDAGKQSLFSGDDYLRRRQAKSILCIPLIKQGQLTGLLYLENRLTSYAFPRDRIAILELLAAQAAISLENTRLYSDLQEREAKVRRLVDANIIGIFIWDFDGRILEANDAFLRTVGYDREGLVSGRIRWTDLTPSDWLERDAQIWIPEHKQIGLLPPFEKEYFRKDGSRVPVLLGVATFSESGSQGVAFVLDLTERKRAETEARESERRYRETQMQLAHANRVETMGQLTASIAHEVSQPITATVTSAEAALRWLRAQPPNLDEVGQALGYIVRDGARAGAVLDRIRNLIKKAPPRAASVEIIAAIREVIELTGSEAIKHGVLVRTDLAEGLPRVRIDRVELQQVILNLILNAVEAMSGMGEEARELLIGAWTTETDEVLVAVRDSGPGLAPATPEHLFQAFHTTKPNGLGLGLSICRSIIESRGGRLWATANSPGAVFQFTLPAHLDIASRQGLVTSPN
jgi:PAS domain S-box-containing protein